MQSRSVAIRSINTQLLQAERAMTSNDGLKGRQWYRHMLYAPGFYTGYGVKTMPGRSEVKAPDLRGLNGYKDWFFFLHR